MGDIILTCEFLHDFIFWNPFIFHCRTFFINLLNVFITGGVGVLQNQMDVCPSTLTSGCGLFSSRASGERRPAGAHSAERRVQRQEGKDPAAQVGRAEGHPLWHLSDRGLREGQPDWEVAHLTPGGGEGERSEFGVQTNWQGVDLSLSPGVGTMFQCSSTTTTQLGWTAGWS